MLVRETFRLYATGEYSLPELQATMHAKGLRSPYARSNGAPVAVSKLAELLTNPFYLGVVQWGASATKGSRRRSFARVCSTGSRKRSGLATWPEFVNGATSTT